VRLRRETVGGDVNERFSDRQDVLGVEKVGLCLSIRRGIDEILGDFSFILLRNFEDFARISKFSLKSLANSTRPLFLDQFRIEFSLQIMI
jgi:hypothetical protein